MGRLRAEYVAAMRTMPLAKAQQLAACGIPWSAITAATPVPMRITISHAGDRYRPDADGRWGWVLPAAAIDPAHPDLIETDDPLWAIGYAPFIDLAAAYSPAAPGPWALRRGRATVLGAVPPQYLDPEPVRVHRDVAAWLRAGCTGIVLLTPDTTAIGRILNQIQLVGFVEKPPTPPPPCPRGIGAAVGPGVARLILFRSTDVYILAGDQQRAAPPAAPRRRRRRLRSRQRRSCDGHAGRTEDLCSDRQPRASCGYAARDPARPRGNPRLPETEVTR
jgi:hypothetical protein